MIDFKKLKNIEMKKRLKLHNLKQSGTKQEMIHRMTSHNIDTHNYN